MENKRLETNESQENCYGEMVALQQLLNQKRSSANPSLQINNPRLTDPALTPDLERKRTFETQATTVKQTIDPAQHSTARDYLAHAGSHNNVKIVPP